MLEKKPIHHLHLESIDSTNDYVKKHYEEFDLGRLSCVSATMQTSGRGTKQKSWNSTCPHNIYATFFFETHSAKDLQCIAQLLSLSTAKVIEKFGLFPTIKWPNDILIDHKKLGGVLCEIISTNDASLVVIGIGLNVNMPKSVLDEIDQPANSLFVSTGKVFSSRDLLKKIGEEFQKDLYVFLEKGFKPFCAVYNSYMVYRELPVVENEIPIGFSQRVTENGFLECRGKKGEISYISSGSIDIRSSKH
ncbi:biotin--[acetyl-CoA-carboxylase] ligase [Candidatus Aerophobetes bacterium]|uniref:Biotin--[acetyl-CoA-carboxylase] ligase n=1 Tax=Aerophobetes bacterium TaxID=2030807 RepID=A0A2A4YDQ7_UNCAE|nr:MAG: biotin--[acetyl-CoA-carboxylase] ligase [Candidatus Aerophobetes bacterium]